MIAAVLAPDLVALAVLALFAGWGAFRGSLRQLGMLAVAVGGIPLATRFGPHVESAARKVFTVDAADLPLVGWAAAYVAVLVAGGVLLAIAQPLLKRARLPGERSLAAVLGVLHGALLLTVVVLGLEIALGGSQAPRAIRTLERSATAQAAELVGRAVRATLPLPPALADRLARLDAWRQDQRRPS